ncbi:sigma-70 family RNA polymerase sigma factor [Fulvivirgaceae bacterium PWU20]|uniref:RNA polymerase sigma factor SigS n=1 Tax=Chryseosolibacter indicus TaxID=2782351 RepID=A0ABS5VXS1_9BACT|nr:sigma-70 family RNA polymerase sigma factor [Chryseosolibacter indicus]
MPQGNKITQQEFVELVESNKRLIYKICHVYAHTAEDKEDLYQEILVQLWSSLPAFRHESKFTTWMYRVALNTAIAGLRKRKTTPLRTELDEKHIAPAEPVYMEGEPKDPVAELYAAIQLLTPIEKAIVTLYLEDKSYDEMEDVLGIAGSTLRVKMTRIKDKLQKLTSL